ncbi:uncharacterized protein LOC135833314 [Planococcus citri]|uniref:uncharacterized protein LOC135833314 n=1 Tax=Planococcus citri TaxID=170843 RepID=UPI0031F8BE79
MNILPIKIIPLLGILFCYFHKSLCSTVSLKVTHEVFLDITIDGKDVGRITVGLFGDDVPKTVKNFLTIATKGIKGRTYAGTRFNRLVPRHFIQAGDIVNNDGTGSVSIYGEHFPDENFKINHTAPGFVSMANSGPNTNGCQFFITTLETPMFNRRNVVFGKVIKGQNIVHLIEYQKRNYYNERPLLDIRISACGEYPVSSPYYVSDHPYTLWAYFSGIVPPLCFSLAILGTFQWIMNRLDAACI